MRVELSALAERDIQAIAFYTIENFGRAQADDYIGGLFNSFDILSDNPELGRQIQGTSIRRYIFRVHHVYYEPRDTVIRIAHIRHGSQTLPDPEQFYRS